MPRLRAAPSLRRDLASRRRPAAAERLVEVHDREQLIALGLCEGILGRVTIANPSVWPATQTRVGRSWTRPRSAGSVPGRDGKFRLNSRGPHSVEKETAIANRL